MKILITGGSGFLGRRAAEHFSRLGYTVQTPSHAQLDITETESVDAWFLQNHPQAVIHCAAISDTGLCQRQPEWSQRINVTGSVNLAHACEQIGAKFVFCSSDQVYACSAQPGPHSESEPVTPGTVYARQKLLAEQQCRITCPDTVCLRLSWMYSSRFLPDEHSHLLTQLLDLLQGRTTSLTRSVRDFRGITDVDSVVKNLPAVLDLKAGVYNFGAENDMDAYNTLRSVFTELGLDQPRNRLLPDHQVPPRDIRMDGSLAAAQGITFASTRTGLCDALKKIL